jgi:hypothetical protein
MCRALSFYAAEINGDIKIWISEQADDHTKIVEEHNLRDNGRYRLFAGEFHPEDEAPSPDTTTWILAWDSAATLACREKPDDEFADRVRQRLERLVQRYICTSGEQTVTVRGWAFGDARQTVNDGEGEAYDRAKQTVNDGLGWAYDRAAQTVNGGAGVAHDRATQIWNGGDVGRVAMPCR